MSSITVEMYKAYLAALDAEDIEGVPWDELEPSERRAWEAAVDYILEVTE
jgi:hypothetical protein